MFFTAISIVVCSGWWCVPNGGVFGMVVCSGWWCVRNSFVLRMVYLFKGCVFKMFEMVGVRTYSHSSCGAYYHPAR